MSIQQDILETVGSGGIEVHALQKAVGNIGANELQCAVDALLRAKRLRVIANRYELIPSTRPLGGMPHTGRPPSAEEEAAASLLPSTRVCVTCKGPPQALCEFRIVGPGNTRSCECNTCHGRKTRAGLTKQRGQRALVPVNGGSGVIPTDASSPGAAVQPDGSEPSPTSSASSSEGAKINTVVNGSGDIPAASSSVLERAQAKRREVLNRLALVKVDLANLEMALEECERFIELYQRFAEGIA